MASRNIRFDRQESASPHILPAVPQVKLNILRGKARNLTRPVKPPIFLIGSAEDSDLVLAAPEIPEAYAYITVAQERVLIQHLGMGPELWVNGTAGEGFLLSDGDQVGFGPFAFSVEVDQGKPRRRDELPEYRSEELELFTELQESGDAIDVVRALVAAVRAECKLPVPPPRIYGEERGLRHDGDGTTSRFVA